MKTYRIGVLGLHHDHVWTILEQFASLENAKIAAAADIHRPLLHKFDRLYGGATYHQDYTALLDREDLDVVLVYGSNRVGSRLAVEAMNRGLHALVEKPMAADRADADLMLAAAGKNNVRLMINWPFAWWYQLQHALYLALEQDFIGRVFQMNYRAAHEGIVEMGHSHYFAEWAENPELSGGGALIDYCCYGAVLSRVLMGQPEAVTGLWGNLCKDYLTVDDNAVIVMKYPKAMSVAQASWTQHGKIGAYTPMIYGQRGTFVIEPRTGGRLFHADDVHQKGVELEVPTPAPHMTSAAVHFLWSIENRDKALHPLCDPLHARDANAIMDAGVASAKQDSRLVPVAP